MNHQEYYDAIYEDLLYVGKITHPNDIMYDNNLSRPYKSSAFHLYYWLIKEKEL